MKILVYGWYNHQNVGDDLFADAFKGLFPQFTFQFVDQIRLQDLRQADAVFFGGGSFLGSIPNVEDDAAWELLPHKPILYIGVGAETEINVFHHQLMRQARLVAIRTPQELDKILSINPNTIVIPDLVHSLTPTKAEKKISKSVLVIPNINVVPSWSDEHWKHASWEYFKSEFCQFMDGLAADGYHISFLPFCTDRYVDDSLAAAELIGRMNWRDRKFILPTNHTLQTVTETISRYNVVITQRYHGIILAEMLGSPCLSIVHHDKLKNSQGPTLSYYGITKDKLRTEFDQLLHTNVSNFLPIDRDMFVQLQQAVLDALGGDQEQQSTDSIE